MENIRKKIGIIGDSILKGVIFDELIGKYRFLKDSAANLFGSSNQVEINNQAAFGCTTAKAMEKLPRVLEDESDIVLLELGGNDCDYNWDAVCEKPYAEHLPNTPYAEFKKNVREIIERVLNSGKRPVIMTLPPIDSDRYFNWIVGADHGRAARLMEFLGDKSRIYRHQELYASALENIAASYNLATVPVRETLLAIPKYSDYMCVDGIHLNERGQEKIKQICDQRYREYLNTL